ncbi:1,4-dihydroxy-2-naphthoyl-CoA hydrolase [Minicystis rosea]|nr:1,4-dihydroxy-2-naphthoyl-CoA hydrolase [Minicystis rosea]
MSDDRTFTTADLKKATSVRFAETRLVRFQDVDAAGIIFYPRVLEYMSDVYIAMVMQSGWDLPKELGQSSVGTPLVHAEADYLSPLRFGDDVHVEIVGVRLGATSFTVGYRVRTKGGVVAAVGQTVHVCLDRATFKPQPIPDSLREILTGGAPG